MEFTTRVTLTEERIAEVLVGAWEGGSNYWCESDGQPYRLSDDLLHLPVACRIIDEDQEGEFPQVLDLWKLQRGLDVLADLYPWHLAAILDETDDSGTADALLQASLFGEVLYG